MWSRTHARYSVSHNSGNDDDDDDDDEDDDDDDDDDDVHEKSATLFSC
jgi:hypothetical protein